MQVGVMPPPTVGYQPPHRQQQGLNSSNGSHDVMRNTCKVALIGSKVQRPLMNFCRKCNSPIIIHGRFVSWTEKKAEIFNESLSEHFCSVE